MLRPEPWLWDGTVGGREPSMIFLPSGSSCLRCRWAGVRVGELGLGAEPTEARFNSCSALLETTSSAPVTLTAGMLLA